MGLPSESGMAICKSRRMTLFEARVTNANVDKMTGYYKERQQWIVPHEITDYRPSSQSLPTDECSTNSQTLPMLRPYIEKWLQAIESHPHKAIA
jgi:hypothetical protein